MNFVAKKYYGNWIFEIMLIINYEFDETLEFKKPDVSRVKLIQTSQGRDDEQFPSLFQLLSLKLRNLIKKV